MNNKKVKLSAILLLSFGLTGLRAQEALPASGGNASGNGGTASYVIGQVLYTANTGTGGSESQGVQQPYEISAVTALDESRGITLRYSAYPNPVTDILTLRIEGETQMQFMASLFDINGKLLESKKTNGIETSIDMKNLVPAVYILKVTGNNKEIITFRITKN